MNAPAAIPRARRMRTLPLRRWLVLALVLTAVIPVAVVGMTVHFLLSLPALDRFAAADDLTNHVEQWHDPTWQEAARKHYSPDGIDFVLFENGQEFYRSTADPLVGEAGRHAGRFVEEHIVDGENGAPDRSVVVYAVVNQTQVNRFWVIPFVLLGTLTLILGSIGWFLGRTVVGPLAGTAAAAHQVAEGDLDVVLPSSRVREVAEVNHAFTGMSAALRTSLQQQADLEQQRRMFIGAIVHDLRTPLFTLRGSLEGLETGVADTPEKRAHYIGIAAEKAAALDRLISDLFDFTRLEYLDQAPHRERLDLSSLIRQLVDGIQPQATAKGVGVTFDATDEGTDTCLVDADPHLLTRAVENLLDNALRYTPVGGSVRVTCGSDANGARFTIADTGPGIPAADLPNLFTPLFRGETSRNRRTGGAGLGLTIARRILRAHGGDLTASNAPEGGAVFVGTLTVEGAAG